MYKLLDYDITEYKQLENTLKVLSKQGYNPTSLGKISRFKKNDKHYHYHVDLFIKKATIPKRKALHDFINDYERNMFDYYGKWESLLFLQLKINVLCQKKDKKRLMNI